MLKFPLELAAGKVTVENTASSAKNLNIYVANRDGVAMSIPAGETVEITTLSAGETFMYLSQSDDELKVELAK